MAKSGQSDKASDAGKAHVGEVHGAATSGMGEGRAEVRTTEPPTSHRPTLDNETGGVIEDRTVAHDEGGPVAQVQEHGDARSSTYGMDAETGEIIAGEGSRMRRAFMLKQLLPNKDWIMKNVVGGGAGTRALVGRVVGVAFDADVKVNMIGDQRVESIVLKGDFEYESYVMPDEKGSASLAYLPKAYAEKIHHLLTMKNTTIRTAIVDIDVGLEATGKSIPYEWTTTAFVQGEEMRIMKKLRASRGRPQQLLTAPRKD